MRTVLRCEATKAIALALLAVLALQCRSALMILAGVTTLSHRGLRRERPAWPPQSIDRRFVSAGEYWQHWLLFPPVRELLLSLLILYRGFASSRSGHE